VKLLNAFSAKDSQMVRAVEVLDSFLMVLTQFVLQRFFILLIKIKTSFAENWILLNNFIKDIDIERKSLCTF